MTVTENVGRRRMDVDRRQARELAEVGGGSVDVGGVQGDADRHQVGSCGQRFAAEAQRKEGLIHCGGICVSANCCQDAMEQVLGKLAQGMTGQVLA